MTPDDVTNNKKITDLAEQARGLSIQRKMIFKNVLLKRDRRGRAPFTPPFYHGGRMSLYVSPRV